MLLLLGLLLVLAQGAVLIDKPHSERVTDEYIVIYKKEAGDDVIFAHQKTLSLNIMHYYNISGSDFRGFAAHLTPTELSFVLDNPYVKDVHYNGHVHLACDQTQNPSTSWGLSRLCQGQIDGTLEYHFIHHSSGGQGTNVYVLDTGTNANHEQFNGRVAPGQNFVSGQPPANVDENGHGTHCAGTAAGNTYGIARNARIIPVKVLGRTGSGTWAGVVAGINWCANDHNQPNRIPSVCSMSLGGGYDAAVNGAVEAAINSGLPFCIAAGNSNADACNYSPASAEGAICVGSTTLAGNDERDIRSSFSNHGSCVTIFAPGSDIPSAYIPNSNSYAVLSGTSMACPHVAGVASVLLGQRPTLTPPQLSALLKQMSIKGVIEGLPANTINELLNNGCPEVSF